MIHNECKTQEAWYWCNPKPTGINYKSIDFVNINTGYGVGEGGVFIKTTNKGD